MRIRPSSCRYNSGRRLSFEYLENRQVLSATVTAVLSSGNLTLTGNKNDAYVEVHENAGGGIVVTGLNGTKITYGSNTGTSETVSGVTGNLVVNLPGSGSGTQSFELDSANGIPTSIIGTFTLTMGNESNTVIVKGPGLQIHHDTSIVTGSGNQTIQIGETSSTAQDVYIDGNLSISTGAGNSCVTIFDSVIDGNTVAVKMGSGNNKVVVGSEADTNGFYGDDGPHDVYVQSLSITLGNGNGTVQIDNTEVADGNLTVATGNGNATISIGKEAGTGNPDVFIEDGYLYVSTCPGNANVTVLDTSVGSGEEEEDQVIKAAFISPSSLNPGDMAIELGAGNDTVVIGSTANQDPSDIDVQGNAYVDIGSGNAAISLQSTSVDGNLEMSHQSGNTTITIGARDPYTEGSDVYVGENLTITTGSGNASIAIGGTAEDDYAFIEGNVTIRTGSGNAAISLTNDLIVGNTSITTSSGNSTVSLFGDEIFSNLTVTLGSGNGSLIIKDTGVEDTTTLNGGGNGTLYYDGTDDFLGGLSNSHFKKVTT